MANKLVSWLPESIAPNTITLFGFFHSLLPAVILYTAIGASLFGDVPTWFIFFQAWCFFAYRMLDEMDGKQARRTGNSSPLGLIFDHGCDAMTVGIQTLIFMRILQVGDNLIANYQLIGSYFAFHLATLEEYYVGTMIMPRFNQISDGSVVIIGAAIVTGCIGGNTVWTTEIMSGSWLGIAGV